MKKCPYCAEEIQDEAVKCKFCSTDFKEEAQKISKAKTKKGCTSILLGIIGVTVLIVLLNWGNLKEPVSSPISQQPKQDNNTIAEPEQKISILFDVPSLYGKNIDQVIKILGKPTDDREPGDMQIKATPNEYKLKEFDKIYEKDGYTFSITYNVASRKVVEFFLDSGNPSGVTKDVNKLKKLLNLENPKNFTVEPIKAMVDPSSYTGILVKPK